MKRVALFAGAALLGLALLAGGVAAYLTLPYSARGGTVEVLIEPGGSREIAKALSDAGAVRCESCFMMAAAAHNQLFGVLKAGEYAFEKPLSPLEILRRMAKGHVIVRSFLVPEGKSVRQVVKALMKAPYLKGEVAPLPKEGTLLPETYHYTRGDTRQELIGRMQQAMEEALEAAWQARDKDIPLTDKEQLRVMASLIERETGKPEERALVAGVFYNRLRLGMPLQTDPTVIYAITNGSNELGRALTRKDLQVKHPYNTYANAGLPPGPIANPGKDSLIAAAEPEETDYLYFVADGTGGHRFAVTHDEHLVNVKLWRGILSGGRD